MVDSRVIATNSIKQSVETQYDITSPGLASTDHFSSDDVFTSSLVDTKNPIGILTSSSSGNKIIENLNQVADREKEMMVFLSKSIRQMHVRLDVAEQRNRLLSSQVDSLSAKLNDQLLPVVKAIIQIRGEIRSSSISDLRKRSDSGASAPWSLPISNDRSYSSSSVPTSSQYSFTKKQPLYTQVNKKKKSKVQTDRPLPPPPATHIISNHKIDPDIKAVYELIKPLEDSLKIKKGENNVFKEDFSFKKCSNETIFSKIKRKIGKNKNLACKTSLPRSSEVLTSRPNLKSYDDKSTVLTAYRRSLEIPSSEEVFQLIDDNYGNSHTDIVWNSVDDIFKAHSSKKRQRAKTTNNPPSNQFYELDKILETTRILTLQRAHKSINKQVKKTLKVEHCVTAHNEKNKQITDFKDNIG